MFKKQRQFTFVDLFSGAGGFTEGLLLASTEKAHFRLVAASDVHLNAQKTHVERFQKQLSLDYDFLLSDIRARCFAQKLANVISDRMEDGTVDVVVGAPPCQGFSVFGRRKETDSRNGLFLPYLNAIQVLKPKYFVMENVPGLATMYGGKTVDQIFDAVGRMRPIRYKINGPIKVKAEKYGVPQLRERILFVGHRGDMEEISCIPVTYSGPPVTVQAAIGDLAFLRPWETDGAYHPEFPAKTRFQKESRRGRLYAKFRIPRKQHGLMNHQAARHNPAVLARFAMIQPGKGLDSIPRPLWETHLRSSKKWCVRLRADQPSYTLVTLPDDFVHYSEHRILTVREMARLQSFDDTFEFIGPRATGGGGKGNKKRNVELPQYTQVGNAVPPLMAKAIGSELLRVLADS